MSTDQTNNLDNNDLSEIRDAVPALDLLAIRSLRRAGFQIVKQDSDAGEKAKQTQAHNSDWSSHSSAA